MIFVLNSLSSRWTGRANSRLDGLFSVKISAAKMRKFQYIGYIIHQYVQTTLQAPNMKVKELQKSLQDVANVLELAGTKAVRNDLANVLKLLDGAEELELDVFLSLLEERMAAALKKTGARSKANINREVVDLYVARLQQAAMDEKSFSALAAELKNDPKVRKAELSEIAKGYNAPLANTVAGLHKAIQTRFYERIYDRDATDMARRATPW